MTSIENLSEIKRLLKLSHEVASDAHVGQKRKDGKPYLTHLEAVAAIINKDYFSLIPNNDNARKNWGAIKYYVVMAGLLHDTIEDTYITSERLLRSGIPVMVVDIVETVTKRPCENYFDFIMRIHKSGNVGAKAVKLADLRHNMSDLEEGSLKDKYRFAAYILTNHNESK
jgi:GTP pyrophosphokinase